MRHFTAIALALLASSCLRKTEFQCETSADCGNGNTCESTHYCSFADSECQRYTESAGTLAGQCVGGTSIDAGLIDAPDGTEIDAPPSAGCPAGYNALPGVSGGHLYRIVTNLETWDSQKNFCAATSASAYLAIPDDLTEITAMSTAAGGMYWVGISDQTEGQFVNVKGQPQVFLPWNTGEPNNSPAGADCVNGTPNAKISDDRCQTKYRAICECEP